ncbi:hypothetical protein EDB81DRAFT_455336 [Dactylonectria macrodidyma]|uniref:Zn(2)-C6 fungal-type domain-containing protein n=1 Tax=Dactylonectria macrodidyma TaxID=307937 RepID=A0A9P9J8I5_9HYPO|nr:hypothetical protein EDB81DRAFT_455336 [Dactylonectria macrodidyma]
MRRGHTKSRAGCIECKRRKVKCDEVRPSCFNCSRRGSLCSLATSRGSSTSSNPAGPRSAFSSYHGIPSPLSRPTTEVWDGSLELMHHYATITANTLAMRPEMQHVWRAVVPETGYRHPFVTHGILAVAALHKAHLLPANGDKYLNAAAYHQMLGLKGFREALASVNHDNWEPSFCFSSTIVLCGFCMPALGRGDEMSNLNKIFVMIRGLRNTLWPSQGQIRHTQYAPWSYGIWVIDENSVADGDDPPLDNCSLPRDTFDALSRLSTFFDTNLPQASRGDYEIAVTHLRIAARLMAHAGARAEVGMLLFFPYVIPDSIVADIQAASPYAMVLLSYFILLLNSLESKFWFLRGWSERLLAITEGSLVDYPKLQNIVAWPREHLNSLS